MDELLTEKELSKKLKRGVQTLRNERARGTGFPYLKIGRSVRYVGVEVEKILESKKIHPKGMLEYK